MLIQNIIRSDQQNIMSKKLFTKLQLAQHNNKTQQAVSQVLQRILNRSVQKMQQVQLKRLSKYSVTKQLMFKEINTIGQAFITRPMDLPLHEDMPNTNVIRQGCRPFSAKVQRTYKEVISSSKKTIQRSSKRQSIRNSFKQSPLLKKGGIFRPNTDKFYPVSKQQVSDDSFQQAFIDSLRAKKAQEQIQKRSIQRFLKTNKEEQQKYPKMNKKFMQMMGNKSYYYNKNGEAVETTAVSRQIVKLKNNASTPSGLKSQGSKRSYDQINSEITVEYQGKENFFKKSKEQYLIEDKPNVLFYKSNQCRYQVMA